MWIQKRRALDACPNVVAANMAPVRIGALSLPLQLRSITALPRTLSRSKNKLHQRRIQHELREFVSGSSVAVCGVCRWLMAVYQSHVPLLLQSVPPSFPLYSSLGDIVDRIHYNFHSRTCGFQRNGDKQTGGRQVAGHSWIGMQQLQQSRRLH